MIPTEQPRIIIVLIFIGDIQYILHGYIFSWNVQCIPFRNGAIIALVLDAAEVTTECHLIDVVGIIVRTLLSWVGLVVPKGITFGLRCTSVR